MIRLITAESGTGRHYHEKREKNENKVTEFLGSEALAMCLGRSSGGFGPDVRAAARDPRRLAQFSSIGFPIGRPHICAARVLVCGSR